MTEEGQKLETMRAVSGLAISSKDRCNSDKINEKPISNGLNPIQQKTKREDYLEWSDYFMAIAFLSAQRSKDPVTQVGACIVNDDNRIVGIGYNGMPRGCHDDLMPWGRNGESYVDTKYAFVVHAELNAVLNKNSSDVRGCTVYVALFPCNECAKVIIQAGLKEVVYYSDKKKDRPEVIASKKMLDMAGIKYRQHIPKKKQIVIDFETIERNQTKPSGMKLSSGMG